MKKLLLSFLILTSTHLCFAAIAFDGVTSSSGGNGTSLTFASHAITTNNPIAVINILENDVTSSVTAVSVNGVSATFVGTVAAGGAFPVKSYQYILPGATTGNVVITSGSPNLGVDFFTYSGASQTLQPNVSATPSFSGVDFTQTLTTTVDGCWIVASARLSAAGSVSITSGLIQRPGGGGQSGQATGDTNGSVGVAGTYNAVFHTTSSGQWQGIILAIAPALVDNTPRFWWFNW